MIQGTMSNAGKSVLTAGILRVLAQDGLSVCPFKSQNMALNSFITREGLEMGRAQVMQAEAAGIQPDALMNPILLKPTTDVGSQVIVNGRPVGNMSAMEYYRRKKEFIPVIMAAYENLARRFDVIVIEGAGSPAEINLKENDIVNMGLAKLVDAPVLLVGDIDRGGVFAQIVGTIVLLEEEERRRIKGTIINKFRGDKKILQPGLDMLVERTGIPVCGVVPYFFLDIDDEDSLTERFRKKENAGRVDIAVIRLPRISNFTDFAPLESIEDVSLRYVGSTAELGNPDMIILPGTKSTIADLLWLRENGLEAKIKQYASRGGIVFGICGGYQMLGETIEDSEGVETGTARTVKGMGLLPVHTVFEKEKRRTQVNGRFGLMEGTLSGISGAPIEGYEIHMGRTEMIPKNSTVAESPLKSKGNRQNMDSHAKILQAPAICIRESDGNIERYDGYRRGNVLGCYIHGLFDSGETAGKLVQCLLEAKGLTAGEVHVMDRKQYKEEQYDKLADIIRENLDMKMIYGLIS